MTFLPNLRSAKWTTAATLLAGVVTLVALSACAPLYGASESAPVE